MPNTTGQGITYPISTDTVHLTDDLATMANSVDSQLATDRALRDGTWTLYAPDITGSAGGTWTKGTATVSVYYMRMGRTVFVNGEIVMGSTTSFAAISGSFILNLPFAARNNIPGHVGSGHAIDASPTAREVLACRLNSTTHVFFIIGNTGSTVQTAAPWTWAQSDILAFQLIYDTTSTP